MPIVSKSQNRLFRWAEEHPGKALVEKGIKPAVTREFLGTVHGAHIGNLPERVRHKAIGGAVRRQPMKW
jgi:hypothetical protein